MPETSESLKRKNSEEELALLKELLRRKEASQSLQKYIEYLAICPTPSKHHRLLIEKLELIVSGELKRLMVWMPPGSAKSTYASVLFPPYYMGRNGTASILGVSNTTELAERFSRRARNIVASPRFNNIFGFGCNEDNKAAGSWENSLPLVLAQQLRDAEQVLVSLMTLLKAEKKRIANGLGKSTGTGTLMTFLPDYCPTLRRSLSRLDGTKTTYPDAS